MTTGAGSMKTPLLVRIIDETYSDTCTPIERIELLISDACELYLAEYVTGCREGGSEFSDQLNLDEAVAQLRATLRLIGNTAAHTLADDLRKVR